MPELRPEAIPRDRLLWELQAAVRRPLTVVCAPAGYGKTTAVVQWLERSGIARAWLSVEPHHDDPRWLAARLLAALDRALPGRLALAERALQAGSDLHDGVLPLVLAALDQRQGARLAIVLDDYHAIESAECHRLVAGLVDGAPSGVGMIVATRTPPPLRLARRRAAGTLAEIGPRQLRFAPEEYERLLNGSLSLELSRPELEAIDEAVDGWAAGLALIATGLRAGRHRASLLDAIAESHSSLTAYLTEEVLDAVRPELRDFLCRTSIPAPAQRPALRGGDRRSPGGGAARRGAADEPLRDRARPGRRLAALPPDVRRDADARARPAGARARGRAASARLRVARGGRHAGRGDRARAAGRRRSAGRGAAGRPMAGADRRPAPRHGARGTRAPSRGSRRVRPALRGARCAVPALRRRRSAHHPRARRGARPGARRRAGRAPSRRQPADHPVLR